LPLLTFFVIVSCIGFGLALLSQPLNARHTLNTRRGTLKGMQPDAIIEYVQRNVPAGETMLVYPYLPLYYYLTATFSPSRYEYLQPGLHTAEQVHELIKEVEADQTRMILFEPSFREKALNVFPATSTDVLTQQDPMADYIESHYKKCTTLTAHDFWRFFAMVRKDLVCP